MHDPNIDMTNHGLMIVMNKFNFTNSFDFIDIHYHANPDLYKRKYNVLQVGRKYQQLNGAVVLKSHLGSTAVQATIAQNEGLPVFPSMVLNDISGGIQYKSILRALAEYQPIYPSKLIVDLPTITGRKHSSKLSRAMNYPHMRKHLSLPTTINIKDKFIKNTLKDIFKLGCDYPVVISTGHSSKEEVYSIIDLCDQVGSPPLLLNQPANPLTGLKAHELIEISKLSSIWIEQTALTYLLSYQEKHDLKKVLTQIKNVIYSSDLGQVSQIDIMDWIEQSEKLFSEFRISTSRKVEICLINPSALLTI